MAENCELIGSPPSTRIVFKSIYLPNSLINLNVCTANSRVGARMSARAFEFGCRDCSFSNRGIKKQAVFPEPIHSKCRSFILEIYFSLWYSIELHACFCHRNNISALQNHWNGFSLNWRW